MMYRCGTERRRIALLRHPTLNGIDFLEVLDSDAADPADRQRVLRLRLLRPLGGVPLPPEAVRIEGGDRIRDIHAVATGTDPASPVVVVRLNRWGDFSTYVLRLTVPAGFDPMLSSIPFSFKAECPADADCTGDDRGCGEDSRDQYGEDPHIDYLTRDFRGFRRLMLDRMSTLLPAWTERHTADLGNAVVDLCAYVLDQISYAQDAIATEAYLATARRRVSVRRHARLVDYRVDEGAAARVLVTVRVAPGAGPVVLPATPRPDAAGPPPIRFLTRDPATPLPAPVVRLEPSPLPAHVLTFELAEESPRTLHEAHNEMALHTWGEQDCCLPRGATEATLAGDRGTLRPGDVLILAEKISSRTGLPGDADPARRHAVRLTRVSVGADALAPLLAEPPPAGLPDPQPVTTIAWDPADALPFPFPVSAQIGDDMVAGLSVAYGNVVLADHGRTIPAEELPPVPAASLAYAGGPDTGRALVRARYRPVLAEAPLTWQSRVPIGGRAGGTAGDDLGPYDPAKPAADLFLAPRTTPALSVTEPGPGRVWAVRPDLLASGPSAPDLMVEVDDDGRAGLRFGDDRYGREPAAGARLRASYRVGNGAAGNIAADAIRQIVTTVNGVASVTNPLPGWGGREPETLDEVRERAPVAFRTPQRAVTADDYATLLRGHPDVQRAVATMGWTGSWRTVFLAVDAVGGRDLDATFEQELRAFLEPFRLAGHDLELTPAVTVPLEIAMTVRAAPDRFPEDVRAVLLDVFGARGSGAFAPDRLTFGQSVRLSPLYALAQAVPGVRAVEITTFRRLGRPDTSGLQAGELRMGRAEIARLDNDPGFPDRGVLRITMEGGR